MRGEPPEGLLGEGEGSPGAACAMGEAGRGGLLGVASDSPLHGQYPPPFTREFLSGGREAVLSPAPA